MIKSRKLRRAGIDKCVREERNVKTVLIGKGEEKRALEGLCVDGRTMFK
jgi:hypothetical protein